jgi:hypothetical protein
MFRYSASSVILNVFCSILVTPVTFIHKGLRYFPCDAIVALAVLQFKDLSVAVSVAGRVVMQIGHYLKEGTLNIIECRVWKYEHYEVVESAEPDIGDKGFDPTYIVGATGSPTSMNRPQETTPDVGKQETVYFNDGRLLLELLSLHKELSVHAGGLYGEGGCERYPKSAIDIILGWSRKKGLLFDDNEAFAKFGRHGIGVEKFYGMLEFLWIAFELFRRIKYNEKRILGNKTYDLDTAKYNLEAIQNRMFPVKIGIDLSGDTPKVKYIANDMLGAGFIQLLFNAVSPETAMFDICQNCSQPYMRSRANRKYCDLCHKTRYQITRDRKRKEKTQNEQAPE